MKVKTITYQQVKNLGNYESKRMEVTVEINGDENIDEISDQLRAWVETQLEKKINNDDVEPPF